MKNLCPKVILLLSIFFCFVTPTFAATDLVISETNSNIDSKTISLDINSKQDKIQGVTVILNMSENFNVSNIQKGDVNCSSFDYNIGDSGISITCLEKEPLTLKGTLATITIPHTEDYELKINKDSSDIAGSTFGNITNIEIISEDNTIEENNASDWLKENLLLIFSSTLFISLAIVLVITLKKKQSN